MLTSLDIKEPGLNVLPLGVERYIVNGGGLTGVQILPEDEIEIINDEGNQVCEISVFNKDGKSELAILNLKENKNSSEIKKILSKHPFFDVLIGFLLYCYFVPKKVKKVVLQCGRNFNLLLDF